MHTEIFKKLYYQGRNQKVFDAGLERVNLFITSNFNGNFNLKESRIGRHVNIKGYELQIENDVAFFPISTNPIKNHAHIDWLGKIFLDIDLIVPPFCPFGILNKFANDIRLATDSKLKNNIVKHYFTLIYPPPTMAAMCTERYKNNSIISLRFYNKILQAIKAYYCGLYEPAITSLIPCFEHIIKKLGVLAQNPLPDGETVHIAYLKQLFEKIRNDYIDISILKKKWYPRKELTVAFFESHDEVLQSIQSIVNFVELMYVSTKKTDEEKIKPINRHVLVHALQNSKIEDVEENDFFRFITFLNALLFCSSFSGGEGSIFCPEETVESKSLASQFTRCDSLSLLTRN